MRRNKVDDSTTDLSDSENCITITDRAARRRFIRSGSAFLLGSASVGAMTMAPSQALADCDNGGNGAEKRPEDAGNGSDSDTGAGADPAGCGRRYEDKPKLSRSLFTEVGKLKS